MFTLSQLASVKCPKETGKLKPTNSCKKCLHYGKCLALASTVLGERQEASIYVRQSDGTLKKVAAECHFPAGDHGGVWDNVRVWYPPGDPDGQYYLTKLLRELYDPKKQEVTVIMELIPE